MQVSMPQHLGISWRSFIPGIKSPTTLPLLEDMGDLRGKRVMVRASLNVPVKDGRVVDDYRLRAVLPIIEYLRAAGARTILVGHIGRDPKLSLRPVCEELNKHVPAMFISDVVGDMAKEAANAIKDGEVLMLENLRSHPGERGNTDAFARELAAFADVYVNDAFAVCHRAHASIVSVPRHLPHFAGPQLTREVKELARALTPKAPSIFILGGDKFQTKKPLIEKFLTIYDTLFIGGAIANDFFNAMGYSVGVSESSKILPEITGLVGKPNILRPVDVYAYKDGKARVTTVDAVESAEYIAEIGPETLELLEGHIARARDVLWNGPLGDIGLGYGKGTEGAAKAIAASQAESIIGGGDTVAAIARLDLEDKFTFISTGGGAMLQFLANETLPGIEALQK